MSALTVSHLTKWPGCIAIWTSYTSNGVKAESPPPFPSHPWLLGKPKSPSPSTGCLLLVELCMTGESGGTPLSLKHFKRGKEYKMKRTRIVIETCSWLLGVTSWVYLGLSSLVRLKVSHWSQGFLCACSTQGWPARTDKAWPIGLSQLFLCRVRLAPWTVVTGERKADHVPLVSSRVKSESVRVCNLSISNTVSVSSWTLCLAWWPLSGIVTLCSYLSPPLAAGN